MSQGSAGLAWIKATAAADSALLALLPDGANGIHFYVVPDGHSFPALIINYQSTPLVNNATGNLIYEDATAQIKGVGPLTNMDTLVAIQVRLQALFGSDTIQAQGGNYILSCVAEQEIVYPEYVSGDVEYLHMGYLCCIKIQ